MLRFLLKMLLLLCFSFSLLLLLMLSIGKTAPPTSKLAFFADRPDGRGSDYWRVDLLTGIAFKDSYSGRIFIPNNLQAPISHFLSIRGDANYYTVSEVNLYTQELRFVSKYPSRNYTLLLAGDYLFTYDLASQWERIHIPDSAFKYFGRHPNLEYPRVSPDGQWLAGYIYNGNWLFINILDGSSYELSQTIYLDWSPDGQWYLAGDYQTISVFNSSTRNLHPNLDAAIPAHSATWSNDGQSLVLENDRQLALLSLATGAIQNYPFRYSFYWLQCLSPNQRFILSYDETALHLLDLASQASLWQFNINESPAIYCHWSADSQYLVFYLNASINNLERFFVLNTLTNSVWDLYPENLPSAPIYLHIPD